MVNILENKHKELAELTLIRKDGSKFFGEFSVSAVKDVEGNPQQLIAITKDISRQKLNQEMLRIQRDASISFSNALTHEDIIEMLLNAAVTIEGVDSVAV